MTSPSNTEVHRKGTHKSSDFSEPLIKGATMVNADGRIWACNATQADSTLYCTCTAPEKKRE